MAANPLAVEAAVDAAYREQLGEAFRTLVDNTVAGEPDALAKFKAAVAVLTSCRDAAVAEFP